MQFLLPFEKSIELSFNLGISGTSTKPNKVYVSIEHNGMALSFNAVPQDISQTNWMVIINEPGNTFGHGQVNFSINVIINNRLFTPYKSSATILEREQSAEVINKDSIKPLPIQSNLEPIIPALEPIQQAEIQTEQVKQVSKPFITPTPSIEQPVKLQLLKTIEVMAKKPNISESKPILKKNKTKIKESLAPFSFKRKDIVYID